MEGINIKMEIPEIVFLKLTSKCNNNCKYCYDSKKHPDLSLKELKKIFKLVHNNGAEAIVLTGGEPLLRKEIPEIFRAIKKCGLKIYLDTSGDFFFKYKKEIEKYVDTIGLPLDYASDKKAYRSSKNFRSVLKILKFYSETEKGPKIRIGTVVTKENIVDIEKIGQLLKKYKIDSWKIYQFIPLGPNGFTNRKSLLVNAKSFLRKTKTLEKKYSKHFKVIIDVSKITI